MRSIAPTEARRAGRPRTLLAGLALAAFLAASAMTGLPALAAEDTSGAPIDVPEATTDMSQIGSSANPDGTPRPPRERLDWLTEGQKQALKAARERWQRQQEELRSLFDELKGKKEALRALIEETRQSGDKEAWAKLRVQLEDLRAIQRQLRDLREQNRGLREELKAAAQGQDFDGMMRAIAKIEANRNMAINLLKDGNRLVDRIVSGN